MFGISLHLVACFLKSYYAPWESMFLGFLHQLLHSKTCRFTRFPRVNKELLTRKFPSGGSIQEIHAISMRHSLMCCWVQLITSLMLLTPNEGGSSRVPPRQHSYLVSSVVMSIMFGVRSILAFDVCDFRSHSIVKQTSNENVSGLLLSQLLSQLQPNAAPFIS